MKERGNTVAAITGKTGRRRKPKTFVAATDDFLKASPWLGPTEAPAVATLQNLALVLDKAEGNPSSSLVGQYTLASRDLVSRGPGAKSDDAPEVDPVEALIAQGKAASVQRIAS